MNDSKQHVLRACYSL